MTAKEAAAIIGCTARHVRTLIRSGRIKARRIKYPTGHCYVIAEAEAIHYRDTPQPRGWPRGQSRKPKGKRNDENHC